MSSSQIPQIDAYWLLDRSPMHLDISLVRPVIAGRRIMVTGAAGSVGSELCRQILKCEPAELVCMDRSETGLFELGYEIGDRRCSFELADYGHKESVSNLFSAHPVQIIFHAAAYKHVPLLEANPRQALQNNVFGFLALMEAAEATGCEDFILVSTDKAVRPASIMGASKRISELVLRSSNEGAMRRITIRLGNVLGSQGSVLTVFQKQLAEAKTLTVTHPDATRYFLPIGEAAFLVQRSACIGNSGEIMAVQLGQPVRILDLAYRLAERYGSKQQMQVVITGLRRGEKVHEDTFHADEVPYSTSCPELKRIVPAPIDAITLRNQLKELQATMFQISDSELRAKISVLVPEYTFEKVGPVTQH